MKTGRRLLILRLGRATGSFRADFSDTSDAGAVRFDVSADHDAAASRELTIDQVVGIEWLSVRSEEALNLRRCVRRILRLQAVSPRAKAAATARLTGSYAQGGANRPQPIYEIACNLVLNPPR